MLCRRIRRTERSGKRVRPPKSLDENRRTHNMTDLKSNSHKYEYIVCFIVLRRCYGHPVKTDKRARQVWRYPFDTDVTATKSGWSKPNPAHLMTKNSCPVFRDARRRRLLFPRPFVAFNTRCYGVLVRPYTVITIKRRRLKTELSNRGLGRPRWFSGSAGWREGKQMSLNTCLTPPTIHSPRSPKSPIPHHRAPHPTPKRSQRLRNVSLTIKFRNMNTAAAVLKDARGSETGATDVLWPPPPSIAKTS